MTTSGALPDELSREFLECAARSGMIVWYWPDCTAPQMWFAGPVMGALGYGPGDLDADSGAFDAVVHPEDQRVLDVMVRTIVSEKRVGGYESEYRMRRKDGTYCWVRGFASVVKRPGSETVSAFGITRIIDSDTQREHAARKLTENALQTLLNEIGHPVVLLTAEGFVVQNNEATERVAGRSASGTSVIRYCPFLHEADGTAVIPDFLCDVVRTGQRSDRPLWRFDRWWHVYLVPLRSAGGEVMRVLLLAQDITSLKAEQAAQLAREKVHSHTLVREIHHRIKNNLQGLVGRLRSSLRSPTSARDVIDAAVTDIQSIAAVYGLLARNRQGSIEFSKLVEQLILTVRIGAPFPIRFEFESAGAKQVALTHDEAVPLAVAIGELLTNAVKHTADVPGAFVAGKLSCLDGNIDLDILNAPAQLPEAFRAVAGIRSGLDLVEALLPRGRAHLEISQHGEQVRTRLRILRATAAPVTLLPAEVPFSGGLAIGPHAGPVGPQRIHPEL